MDIIKADTDSIEYVEKMLAKHNKDCMPSCQEEDYKEISFIAKENKKIIGGILAYSVIWKILYIDTLWVDAPYRRQGIATTLLKSVLESAKDYGCNIVHLSTFDFQGLDFYLSQGFEVFGVLDDSPKGHKEYFLSKRIEI
ncbi:GNAT family N-acetyltransferase [Streptococcus ruminantium]|uniref:GNAT family N-acetyltransferase n=1 Tax=Streptococcus ruminantium TaxID=1917441 RepID=UPI0012DD26FE|nr:GNAT family N-acetyltransferase [Streptococcus ruminantium]